MLYLHWSYIHGGRNMQVLADRATAENNEVDMTVGELKQMLDRIDDNVPILVHDSRHNPQPAAFMLYPDMLFFWADARDIMEA
jgi:hypothetical protein